MDVEAGLKELADREAVRELVSRYADCVWRKDSEAAGDLFTEDGVMDTGDGQPLIGREALVAAYSRAFAEGEFMPFVSNHLIELAPGNTKTNTSA